jgi:ribosomal protein S18 acetylase RimI-like enzyme
MFAVYRASWELRKEVQACINSNNQLYKSIIDPIDQGEHLVDDQWAERNYKIREFYLGRADGHYVGMGSYQNLKSCAYIGYFYIKPEFQRKGYGVGLMNFLQIRAITDNLPYLRLFANCNADWAIRFYEKMGFRIKSRNKDEILAMDEGIFQPFYEQKSVLMEKPMPPPQNSTNLKL